MPKRPAIEEVEITEEPNHGNIKAISNHVQFLKILDEDEVKLVVANYFINGCSSCNQMRPIFRQIANKFPNAMFLEVNTDQCREIAVTQGITDMPTFVFYQKGKPIDQVKGAHPKDLEDKVRHYYMKDLKTSDSVTTEISTTKDIDINDYIDYKKCECLNVLDTISFQDFIAGKSKLISDCDEQLILSFGFNQDLVLHGFKIKASEDNAPKTLKIFLNLLTSLDFDNAVSMKPTQEITLSPTDLKGETKVAFNLVKFQKVKSLHIFVPENMSGSDKTEIESLTIFGAPVSKFKGIAGHTSGVVYLD